MSKKSDDDKPDDYKVGYARPPANSRFKPGQSGNPKGRPKGARNFSTEIEAELNARVDVTENGRSKKITKRALVAKKLVNKGAQGDAKAIGLLLQQERLDEKSNGGGTLLPTVPNANDEKVMANIISRFRRTVAGDDALVDDVSNPDVSEQGENHDDVP